MTVILKDEETEKNFNLHQNIYFKVFDITQRQSATGQLFFFALMLKFQQRIGIKLSSLIKNSKKPLLSNLR